MELDQLEAQLEAILFTMGEAVELERMAEALGQESEVVREKLHTMMEQYVGRAEASRLLS